MKNFIMITLGTGLGSGLVVNGELVYGHDGFAGELGHTIVDPDGRKCACGKKGCLETYVSAPGIKRTVFELLGSETGINYELYNNGVPTGNIISGTGEGISFGLFTEEGNYTVIDADVPLSEMFGYSTVLRSLTQGKAEFTMEFSTYRPVPKSVAEEIIQKKQKEKEGK